MSDIAIVGLGGLFAGSRDISAFWRNVLAGNDCLTEVPESHWRVEDFLDRDPAAPDKTYSVRGGFVPEVRFDPTEFGMPPNLMEVTDIVQLLSLTVARDTLSDAGAPGSSWYTPERTGAVFGMTGTGTLQHSLSARLHTPVLRQVLHHSGLSTQDADDVVDRFSRAFAPWEENAFPGLLSNVVAGRVANRFDLGALNCTVDAACGSSLAAVNVAVSELQSGRADLMLTGGCDIENTIFMYMCFAKTTVLSRGDHIRPFDAASDGTLIGEGIGMLALKRLADAERDGDRVYAVLRGIGSSSDGRSKSIYSPNAEGQIRALHRAHTDAGVEPETIGLVECHGTGTPTGDRTELEALSQVLSGADRGSVAVGSVKSQIGHTKGAAGAAGLIKTALALHQKVLPPTINVDTPAAVFADSPLYVNSTTRPWIVEPHRPRRRAGVSAFGFGGTNFHCVVEEADAPQTEVLHPATEVRIWHAPDAAALAQLLTNEPATGTPIPAEHARVALLARTDEDFERLRTEVLQRLCTDPDSFEIDGSAYYRRRAITGRVAAVFAGQGSQYLGMGSAAALSVPAVREAFDAAALAFPGSPPLGQVVFPPPVFSDEERAAQENLLRRTDFAQPAITALAAGQFAYLRGLGFMPDGAVGHSLGELGALWAAGSLSTDELFRLTAARGAAMAGDAAEPSAMAAVYASERDVEGLIANEPDLWICNVNGPQQVVVGGGEKSITRLVKALQMTGPRISRLPVAAAFHTRYVEHALVPFRKAVDQIVVKAPAVPVYANTRGAEYGTDTAANANVLAQQLREPVHFAPQIEQMYADGFRVFVELGPRQVLSGLIRRILAKRPDAVVLSADDGPHGDGDHSLKRTAARLAVLGAGLTGFGRHITHSPQPQHTERMAILVTGANHVADERRAYLDELAAPALAPAPAPAATPAAGSLLAEHLAGHSEYLRGQLRVSEQLTGLLRDQAQRGPIDPALTEGVKALVQHSLELGRTHVQAADTVLRLAHLAGSYEGTLRAATPAPLVQEPALIPSPAPLPAPIVAPAPVPPAPVAVAPVVAVAPAAEPTIGIVLEIVSAQTGYPVAVLDTGMDLESDLGVDSIKRVEIMSAVRERFPTTPELEPERLAELRTLTDINDLLAGVPQEVVGPKAGEGAPGVTPVRPRPLPAPDVTHDAYVVKRALVRGECGLAKRLADALRDGGWDVTSTVDGWLDLVVHIAEEPATVADAATALAEALTTARQTAQVLSEAPGRAAFVTVSRIDGRFGDVSFNPAHAALAGLPGLVKTLAHEDRTLFCRAVDLHPALDDETSADLLLAEIHDADVTLRQAGHDGRRWTIAPDRRAEVETTAEAPNADDVLLIIGGGQGVTAACARELHALYRCQVVLAGRTELTDEHSWSDSVPEQELTAAVTERLSANGRPTPRAVAKLVKQIQAQREIRATLAAIDGTEYVTMDVTNAASVRNALLPYADRITGVVHGAGVLADRRITEIDLDLARHVLAVKVDGLGHVLDALDTEQLRHVMLFSSVAGLFGNPGQAAYAMANQALDGMARALRTTLPKASVTSVAWGAWAGGMVTPELARRFAERGVELIDVAAGARLFAELCTATDAVVQAGPGLTTGRTLRIAALEADPVLADHAIGGVAVLPLTGAIGAMLASVEHRQPRGLSRVAVHRGLVLDENRPSELVVSSGGDDVRVHDGGGKPRYSATVHFELGEPEKLELPVEWMPITPYLDGTLFHGPAFQGITKVDGNAFGCTLPAHTLAGGLCATNDYDPVRADLLPQAAALMVSRDLRRSALPTRVERVEVHAPLGEEFVVVVENLVDQAPKAVCTVTACAPDGRVLLRFTGLELVTTSNLAAKFGR
ncbi:SDR family oxidoreductase [Lentzea sp. BCCO 10_0856]|uniref:SDR family oxidoreductase n=1 Tax=Lentzea miocenica TaxID=3095431 RepID=A0ABU4TF68_9PSEU|nr:SDR family NAD(P)-dependent oxidoreductase [Lentzea sp. BCCO 10_0856]MDX8036715.1 SDR family oxidoreductase [Lentzea sp. BCCO 10_0856]